MKSWSGKGLVKISASCSFVFMYSILIFLPSTKYARTCRRACTWLPRCGIALSPPARSWAGTGWKDGCGTWLQEAETGSWDSWLDVDRNDSPGLKQMEGRNNQLGASINVDRNSSPGWNSGGLNQSIRISIETNWTFDLLRSINLMWANGSDELTDKSVRQ